MAFSAVRIQKIKGIEGFGAIERHGKRQDASSLSRCDMSKTPNNLAWSLSDDPLSVTGALAKRREALGKAKTYGKAAVGGHLLCVVSPEWVAATGDIHDPKNPRNTAIFNAAKSWAEKSFGVGSVISCRMDLDESGGGVVDVVVVPEMRKKVGGKEVSYLALNKAFEKEFGKKRSYSKMQDSWAEYCQQHLDKSLQRGKPKSETQREHVHADIIRPALEHISKLNSQADERLRLASKRAALARRKAEQSAVEEWRKRSIFSKLQRNKNLLEDAEAQEIFDDGKASIQPKLDTALNELGIEKSKVARLESENRKLKLDNNKLSNDLEKIETALCEFAYDNSIPVQHRHSLISKIKSVVSRPLHFLNNVAEAIGFKQMPAPRKKADIMQFNNR